jgi:tRNA-splicing ligase RtcB (3'-phosphate/5'-hydroxy nucleic acid ligase)
MDVTDDKLTVLGSHDERTLSQMRNCLKDDRATAGVLCADGHLGYAQPVGGVIAYRDAVSVSGVGFDIGCGNYAVKTDLQFADLDPGFLPSLASTIAENICFGVGRRNTYTTVEHPLLEKGSHPAWDIPFVNAIKREAANQLGTVGSGNHYVDVFRSECDGAIWVGVHFGSRGLGHKIARHYTKEAGGKDGIDVEPALLPTNSDLGREYLAAMDLAGRYAYAGREWVVHTIVRDFMQAAVVDAVHNHHNYAWKERVDGEEHYLVRKGATPLYPGQRGFVGGSMGDISVILKGRHDGMPAPLLNSTIHGSGRVMSRSQAAGKSKWVKGRKVSRGGGLVNETEWREGMRQRGIILIGAGADEMPPVYRPLRDVLAAHEGTFEIEEILHPLIVVMAGAFEFDPYKD